MNGKAIAFAAVLVAFLAVSGCIVLNGDQDSDAAASYSHSYTWTKGNSINQFASGPFGGVHEEYDYTSSYSGSVPGVSITAGSNPNSDYYGLTFLGIPTTAGSYTVVGTFVPTNGGNSGQTATVTCSIIVQDGTPQVTYRVTFTALSGGTVSPSYVDVASGTTWTSVSNALYIGGYTITSSPNTGYHTSGFLPSSGTVTEDKTVYANFTRNTYTCYLYYNANGGSGAPATDSYTSSSTSTHYFTVSSTVPTRSGYTFLGWATSSSASSASYHDGDSIGVSYNGSKTLYAVWQQNLYTCYLYYNANGGSGAPATDSYTSTSTSSHPFTVSSTAPTRINYTFLGWSESSSASTADYEGGDTISVAYNGSKTLYAVWRQDPHVYNYEWTTNNSVNQFAQGPFGGVHEEYTYTSSHTGSVPGLTITAGSNPNSDYYGLTFLGSPTTAGSYTVTGTFVPTNGGNSGYTATVICNITVVEGPPEVTYRVSFITDGNGTVSQDYIDVPDGTTWSSVSNNLYIAGYTISATAGSGYHTAGFTPSSGTIQGQGVTITAHFEQDIPFYTVTITAGTGGSVSPGSVSVQSGASVSSSGASLTIGSTVVVAYHDVGYSFDSWSNIPQSGTITGPVTITANFTQVSPGTHTYSYEWTTGHFVNQFAQGPFGGVHEEYTYNCSYTGSVPGLTITAGSNPNSDYYGLTFHGVVSTAGTYTVVGTFVPTNGGNSGQTATVTCNITVVEGPPETLYRITFTAVGNGTVDYPYVDVPLNSQFSSVANRFYVAGYTITATPNEGYHANGFSPASGTVTANPTPVDVLFDQNTRTVTIIDSPSEGGSADYHTVTVPIGTSFSSSGNILTIGSVQVSALPATGYTFNSWVPSSGTITADGSTTIYAAYTIHGTTSPGEIPIGFSRLFDFTGSEDCNHLLAQPVLVSTDNCTVTNLSLTLDEYDPLLNISHAKLTGSISPVAVGPFSATITFGVSYGSSPLYYSVKVVGATPGTPVRVEIIPEPDEGGEVDIGELTLPYYTAWTTDGNTLTFTSPSNDVTQVTATPAEGYRFHHWDPASGNLQDGQIIKAVFDRDYHVTVEYDPNADIYIDGVLMEETTTYSVNLDEIPEIYCDPHTGYRFVYYYYVGEDEEEIQTNENPTNLPAMDTTVRVMVIRAGDITVTFRSGGNGIVEPSSLTIPAGSRFIVGSGDLRLEGDPSTIVTATPDAGYVFNAWSENAGGFILTSTTITAYFTYDMGNAVWWENGYANNKATIVLDYPGVNNNLTHFMQIPLLAYDKNATDQTPRYFGDSGYVLQIETGYNKRITITLLKDGLEKYTATYNPGIWQRYAFVIDTYYSTVSFQGISSSMRNPVSEFNFVSYEVLFTKEIADWSHIENDLAFARVYHRDVAQGSNHPNFQIGNTSTFLDTYGFVMIDPTLNIHDQFPSYDNLRLNLYSFALHGDYIIINGHRFDMDGSQVTVRYNEVTDPDGTKHMIISAHGSEYFTANLTNIHVTWNNINSASGTARQCYITFVNEGVTFEAGTFDQGDLTISAKGMWYFTTALWEPHDAVKRTYTMDWNSMFNISGDGFLLIFIALLIIVTVVLNVFYKPTLLDYAVVFGAGLILLILVGTF